MNPFIEHHQQSIRFQYSCFDRMLLNAIVQPMQEPARIVGFLNKSRQVPSITKAYFRSVSEDYHRFVARLAAAQRVQIVQPPKGVRREDWVEPFYQHLGSRFGIAVILKSRENARVAVSYPTASGGNRIEVYTPAPKRVYGYYTMPILHRGELVGRLDPSLDRKNRILTARKIFLEPGQRPTESLANAIAAALWDFVHSNGLALYLPLFLPQPDGEGLPIQRRDGVRDLS